MADIDIEPLKNSGFLNSKCIEDFLDLMILEESNSSKLFEFEVNTKLQKS